MNDKGHDWFNYCFNNIKNMDIPDDIIIDAFDSLKLALKETRKREEAEQKRKEKDLKKKESQKTHEHIEQATSMDLPLDWSNVFDTDPRTSGVHAESISDGLIMSLRTLGRVDIEYISSVTGEDYKTCIQALRGSIYQNPDTWDECFYKGWEMADEYLSGNLRRKLNSARRASLKYGGYFDENIRAIKRVLPPSVSAKDIYVTLGSPWVPTDVIDSFIEHLLGPFKSTFESPEAQSSLAIRHDEATGTWEIPYKSRYNSGKFSFQNQNIYGTVKMPALHIIERTLNMKPIVVMDEIKCTANKSGKKRVINQADTLHALEKQKKIIDEFQTWIWQDEFRKARMEDIFESKFSSQKVRHYDGSFLNFPTMSPEVSLYPYQKNAVARIIFSPNTLLAHEVGSGKTYIMIAASMELRRMGISMKNLFVVPNNLIGQWEAIFTKMYPQAKLLCVTPSKFNPQKRKAVLEDIRDSDYDGIIMPYSCFEMIPLSKDYYREKIEKQTEILSKIANTRGKSTSRLAKKQESLKKSLFDLLMDIEKMQDQIYFDELGINTLFVDEAHNFKNVPIDTQVGHVMGISKEGSAKCQNMMDKVLCVQRQNNGRGVVFATGTPITNSVTDIFIMQKYLQNGELSMLELQSFDSWIGMFAEKQTQFEIDVDTSSYRLATRFSKFHNLPELTSLLASIADFHSVDRSDGIPDFDGYSDVLIEKSAELSKYLKNISERAEEVRHGGVKRTSDNMLKITTDGRKAALDMRLVNPDCSLLIQSKVCRCVENVFNIYVKTAVEKSTQLIFCDTSTPKNGFNIYDELMRLLTFSGIPKEQIAFVHDANTERKRNSLFAKVRRGDVRILIGSTFKLGLGVNVQDRLIALHHIDIPWRPADMVQREGRILRQGNMNPKVKIFRYITEGSFDAYSWQLLETKQRFIVDILSGTMSMRCGTDIDDTVLDYAEIKALAVGNPLVKKRVEKANELTRYLTLHKKSLEGRELIEKELAELPAAIRNQERIVENCKLDIRNRCAAVTDKDKRRIFRKKVFDALRENDLYTKESELCEYRGFKLVLPSNMMKDKPYIWLRQNGKYYLEMGDSELGAIVRIDNFIDNMEKHLEKLSESLDTMICREKQLRQEKEKVFGYAVDIERCRYELEKIDRELGVKRK